MASSPSSAGIVSFGEFEADLRSRELRKNGARVRLPDQAFMVLAILLERPRELVTREEMQREIWPSDTFVDFDHGLNNAVNRLREALGDSAEKPQFVETLPRRGYRFLATVKAHSAGIEPPGNVELATESSRIVQSSRIAGRDSRPPLRKSLFWILALGVIALLFAIKYAYTPNLPASRSYVLPPEGATFNLINDDGGSVVLSPDGRKLAFVAIDAKGPGRIWVRPLSKLSADPLDGTEGATFPFWSPDGQWIAFFANGKLKKVRLGGGPPINLCDAPFGRGGSWKKNVIIFAPASHTGIYKVADSGGSPVQLTTIDSSIHTTHRWPKFLPDGRHFLYLAASHFRDAAHDGLYLGSINGERPEFLVPSESDGAYVSGFLFFYSNGMFQMQRFDPQAGQTQGEPRPTGEKVLYDSSIWKVVFDVSENTMAYELGEKVGGTQLRWLDRSGKELESIGTPVFQWEVQLSPDGKKIATGIGEVGYSNVWVYDLVRRVRTQVTFSKFDHGSAIWSPDGKQLILGSKAKYYTLARIDSNGANSEQPVLDTGTDSWPLDLSKDGRYLLYGQGSNIGRTKSQLWIYATQGDRSPYRLLQGNSVEKDGQFSPNGRWVAYVSDQSGREQVYVVPFRTQSGSPSAVMSERVQVSVTGGSTPRWRPDGREIFYLAPDKTLMSVPVAYRRAKLELGTANALFHINPGYSNFPYDVSADGKRFIVNTAPPEKAAPITLVENWQSDLK